MHRYTRGTRAPIDRDPSFSFFLCTKKNDRPCAQKARQFFVGILQGSARGNLQFTCAGRVLKLTILFRKVLRDHMDPASVPANFQSTAFYHMSRGKRGYVISL